MLGFRSRGSRSSGADVLLAASLTVVPLLPVLWTPIAFERFWQWRFLEGALLACSLTGSWLVCRSIRGILRRVTASGCETAPLRPDRAAGPLLWLTRRGRRFWIVVAITPILYAASVGPWLAVGRRLPASLRVWHTVATPVYVAPLDFVYAWSPRPVQQAMRDYALLWQRL